MKKIKIQKSNVVTALSGGVAVVIPTVLKQQVDPMYPSGFIPGIPGFSQWTKPSIIIPIGLGVAAIVSSLTFLKGSKRLNASVFGTVSLISGVLLGAFEPPAARFRTPTQATVRRPVVRRATIPQNRAALLGNKSNGRTQIQAQQKFMPNAGIRRVTSPVLTSQTKETIYA